MANTRRMAWPFPDENTDPWYEALKSWAQSMDSSGYASREDRQIVITGGGTVSWDASTSTLTWSADIKIASLITGFMLSITAGSASLDDGQVLYVSLTRAPTTTATLEANIGNQVPSTDIDMVLAVRVGTSLYWRNGLLMNHGDSVLNIGSNQGTGGVDANAIHKNIANEIFTILEKTTPISDDLFIIEDSADSYNKKKLKVGNLPPDANAIHKNVAGEINAITAKATPVGADKIVIEDSESVAPVWQKKSVAISSLPGGGGNDSLPGIQQVLFVDKTGSSYTANGTIQFPYNSIDAACLAANALSPSTTNRIGIIVMPGRYNERFRLYDYCYVIGINKDACVMHYAAGSMVLATNVTSGIWNMTIQEESTYYLSWIAQASHIEYHNCHFIGAGNTGNVFYTEDTSVLKCYHCTIENTDPDLEVSWCLESSSQFFYDCEFYGLLYAGNTATTSRYYFKDCRIKGSIYTAGQNSLECYNTDVDATANTTYLNPIYIGGTEEYIKLFNMELQPPGSNYDISFGAQIDIECKDVRMKNGIDRFGFIISQGNEAHIGGTKDCYSTWTNMVQANWGSRGKHRIILHKDITLTAINLNTNHDPVIVDGQGMYTIAHSTPGTTITVQTGWTGDRWTFERVTIDDSLQISTPATGLDAEAIFKDCVVNGAIKHSVGANDGTLLIELIHTKVFGDDVDHYALMIAHGSGVAAKIILTGDSRLLGYTGYPAIYWHTSTGSGDLRILYATVLHGSLGANNPFGDDGSPTTPITHRATHSRFNSDPEASANYVNVVTPGQRFNSFDPAVAL